MPRPPKKGNGWGGSRSGRFSEVGTTLGRAYPPRWCDPPSRTVQYTPRRVYLVSESSCPMGWVLAFLFLLLSALLGYLLYGAMRERAASMARIAELEPKAKSHDEAQAERGKIAAAYQALRKRFSGVVDADAEKAKVVAQTKQIAEKFNAQLAAAKAQYASTKKQREDELAGLEAALVPLRSEHKALSEEAALTEMGFYKSRYGFATSERYKKAIDENYKKQKEMLSAKSAATCTKEWVIDGSAEKGKKQTDKTLSLMLRAFNGECDSAIAKVKATNYQTMENRIQKSFEAINKLGQVQGCELSSQYLELRIAELRLEYEHALKVQAEREEQRAIKEEMRQQAIAEKEAERAQQEAERERRQYQSALEKARAEMARVDAEKNADAQVQQEKHQAMESRIAELEQMMAEANAKQERAMSLAQQTRSGHVYVISNIGSFGTHVYKIGMTRRLDPMDRIWELSDASVPFDFDVHAIIYTDDAPGLESELHQRFAKRRINVVNERKEFFHVTIEEIAEVVRERCGDIELTLAAEAAEFLQSEAYRRENGNDISVLRFFGPPLNAPKALGEVQSALS